MIWAPVIAAGLTAAGSLLGKSERPTIDPEMLKQLFGPGAVGADAQELFRNLLNSPAFAEIMRSASLRGTSLGNQIRSNVAAAGAGGSPIGAFANAAARGYGTALQLPMRAGLFEQALQAALANNAQRLGVFGQSQLSRQEQPTFSRMVGSSLLGAGATGFANWFGSGAKTGGSPGLSPGQFTGWDPNAPWNR